MRKSNHTGHSAQPETQIPKTQASHMQPPNHLINPIRPATTEQSSNHVKPATTASKPTRNRAIIQPRQARYNRIQVHTRPHNCIAPAQLHRACTTASRPHSYIPLATITSSLTESHRAFHHPPIKPARITSGSPQSQSTRGAGLDHAHCVWNLEILKSSIRIQPCPARDGRASHNVHGCTFVTAASVYNTPKG